MLESNQVEIPDLIFQGWEEPEAIEVFIMQIRKQKIKCLLASP